jgi:hypothetical protein
MTLIVAPPNPGDTRSAIADWLELQALLDPRRRATSATLANVLDIASDGSEEREPVYDYASEEELEGEILEEGRSDLMIAVFEELASRRHALAESYPFDVDEDSQVLTSSNTDPTDDIGMTVYLFCLLTSSLREGTLQPPSEATAALQPVPELFQICSCFAAGGFLRGDVAWFGFPRPDGSGFRDATRAVYERFGVGQVRDHEHIPAGFPQHEKDGGIDIIAWRDHPDRMPGKLYMLGQCASGRNWRAKSVIGDIDSFHKLWFSFPPATHVFPAMFIPFFIHGSKGDVPGESFSVTVKDLFWRDEIRFGIVFDRCRLAHYASDCLSTSTNQTKVDAIDRFDEVRAWVLSTLAHLG